MPKHLFTAILLLLPVLSVASAMTVTAAFIALALLTVWQAPHGIKQPRQNMLLLVLMFALPLMSALWSITPKASFTSALGMAALVAGACIGAASCKTIPAPEPRTARLFGYSLLLACVLVLVELLPEGGPVQMALKVSGNEDIYYLDKTMNRSLCALAMLVWPAMLGFHNAGYKKVMWLLLLAVAVPVFILHSLSAKMGIVAGAVVWLLVARWPQAMPRLLAVAVPVLLLAWPLVFMAGEKALRNAPYYEKLPISSQHRVEIWHFTLGKVAEKPLLGWGMNTARAIPGAQELNEHKRTNMPLHPHNHVMQLLLEQGIAGLLFWVTALALIMRRWRFADVTTHARAAMGAGLMAYITMGFTAFGIWQTWWVATGLVAFILVLYFNVVKDRRASVAE